MLHLKTCFVIAARSEVTLYPQTEVDALYNTRSELLGLKSYGVCLKRPFINLHLIAPFLNLN